MKTWATDVAPTVHRHGRTVVAGDVRRLLGDFLPDRASQLLGSVSVPPGGIRSYDLEQLTERPDGSAVAQIRYHTADGQSFVLRSRWEPTAAGWLISQVRNLPETPPRFAVAGPSDDGLDAPYWEGLRRNELWLQRCSDCGTWIWAPRPLCGQCHTFAPGWESVDPVGLVYSWTRTWQPFAPEAAGHLPYVVVLVELPHAGHRRLLGVLKNSDGVTVRVGQGVQGEFDPPEDAGGWPLLRWRLG